MIDPANHPGDAVLNEYLDGELDAPGQAALEAHLAGCGDCARRLAGLEALFLALERLPDEAPGFDLAGPVRRALADKVPGRVLAKPPSNPRQRLILALGAAAQLLLAAAALIWLVPAAAWGSLASELGGGYRAPDLQSALNWLSSWLASWMASGMASWMGPGANRSILEVLAASWAGWISALSQPGAAVQAGLSQTAQSLTQAGLSQVPILEWSLIGLAGTLVWLAGNGILIGSLNRKSQRRNS